MILLPAAPLLLFSSSGIVGDSLEEPSGPLVAFLPDLGSRREFPGAGGVGLPPLDAARGLLRSEEVKFIRSTFAASRFFRSSSNVLLKPQAQHTAQPDKISQIILTGRS